MTTAAISSQPVSQHLQEYFEARQSDLQKLGQALKSGNLAGAQAFYNKIETLGQHGPFGGNPFKITQREQNFNTLGQALQSGDVAGAKQAFDALKDTFQGHGANSGGPGGTLAQSAPGAAASTVPEITLNVSHSSTSPEQALLGGSSSTSSSSGASESRGLSVSA